MKKILISIFAVITSIVLTIVSVLSFNANLSNNSDMVLSDIQERGVRLSNTSSNENSITFQAEVLPTNAMNKNVDVNLEFQYFETIVFNNNTDDVNHYSKKYGKYFTPNEITQYDDYIQTGFIYFSVPTDGYLELNISSSSTTDVAPDYRIIIYGNCNTISTFSVNECQYSYHNEFNHDVLVCVCLGVNNYLRYVEFEYTDTCYDYDNEVNRNVYDYYSVSKSLRNNINYITITKKNNISVPVRVEIVSKSNSNAKATTQIEIVGKELFTHEDSTDEYDLDETTYVSFRDDMASLVFITFGGTLFGNACMVTPSGEEGTNWDLAYGFDEFYCTVSNEYTDLNHPDGVPTLYLCLWTIADRYQLELSDVYTEIFDYRCILAYFDYDVVFDGDVIISINGGAVEIDCDWPNEITPTSISLSESSLVF